VNASAACAVSAILIPRKRSCRTQVLADIRERVLMAPNFVPDKAQRTLTIAMSDVGETVALPRMLQRVTSLAPSVNVKTMSFSQVAIARTSAK
jgi:hypothetical protein